MPVKTYRSCRLAMAIAVAVIGMNTAGAQSATVYKWIDDSGQTHYTDRPPESADVFDTGIRFQRTDPGQVQARAERREEALDAGRQQARNRAEQAGADRAEAERREEERAENCARARERLEAYETAHRLYRQTDDGEREYLTDDEIDQARQTAQQNVTTWCR